jgi:tetratricopeptide (TPR) repeat protein
MTPKYLRTLLTALIISCLALLVYGRDLSQPLWTGTLVTLFAAFVTRVTISSPVQSWLSAGRYDHELGLGKSYLLNGQYSEAVLAFQRTLVHREESSGAHLGMAFSLEKLGHMDSALPEYFRAYFSSYRQDGDTLAVMAGEYLRALARNGGADGLETALKISNNALIHLKDKQGVHVDELKLGRAYVLLHLGNYSEAQEQFEELVRTTSDERIHEAAIVGSTSAGIHQLAQQSPSLLFALLDLEDRIIH